MDGEQFVTVTTYEMEPAEIVTVPAHYSIHEIYEAIRSEMIKRGQTASAQGDDFSTVIIASSEFSLIFSFILHQIIKGSKGLGGSETNTPIGQIASEEGSTKAIIYSMPDLAAAVLHSSKPVEQKKGTEEVMFFSVIKEHTCRAKPEEAVDSVWKSSVYSLLRN